MIDIFFITLIILLNDFMKYFYKKITNFFKGFYQININATNYENISMGFQMRELLILF